MGLQRIAYFLNVFPKVSETFIASELAEVARRGVDLRIFSLRPPAGGLVHGIVARAGLDRRVDYDVPNFAASVAAFRPQIIHAHFAREATAAAREHAARLGVPYTFTAHGYDIYRKAPADWNARAAAAARVVTVSDANAEFIAREFGVAPGHIRVIPCGVDMERFSPGGIRDEPPVILCVARMVAVKNHALLLEACRLLADRGLDFRCVLLGDGELQDEVAARRAALGLEDRVDMPGAAEQDEVRDRLRRASVAVLSSHSEGMPVSLMEAAACGVPAVATAVGGVPELIADGETGFVVPPGDAAALADALARLIADPGRRARMGEAARARATARFSVARQVDRLMEVWSRAIATAGTPA